ncbi:hypothetical protein, partial [Microbacterium sp. Leaf179]|uniref:hypothetical protein n=1 Tax=Microbacterium sp. Leaf179 TaxID=1736288 RepID=UPI001F15C826
GGRGDGEKCPPNRNKVKASEFNLTKQEVKTDYPDANPQKEDWTLIQRNSRDPKTNEDRIGI